MNGLFKVQRFALRIHAVGRSQNPANFLHAEDLGNSWREQETESKRTAARAADIRTAGRIRLNSTSRLHIAMDPRGV